MTKYEVIRTRAFKTAVKKLNKKDCDLLEYIITRLANDEILEPCCKDHPLHGSLKGYRDCHIKNDLVPIYKKDKNVLILTCVNIANHSNSFKK